MLASINIIRMTIASDKNEGIFLLFKKLYTGKKTKEINTATKRGSKIDSSSFNIKIDNDSNIRMHVTLIIPKLELSDFFIFKNN